MRVRRRNDCWGLAGTPKKGLQHPSAWWDSRNTDGPLIFFFAIVIIDPSIKFSLPTALCCNNSWVIVAHSDRMNAGLYESPSLASGSPSNAKHTTYHL